MLQKKFTKVLEYKYHQLLVGTGMLFQTKVKILKKKYVSIRTLAKSVRTANINTYVEIALTIIQS